MVWYFSLSCSTTARSPPQNPHPSILTDPQLPLFSIPPPPLAAGEMLASSSRQTIHMRCSPCALPLGLGAAIPSSSSRTCFTNRVIDSDIVAFRSNPAASGALT